MLAKSKSRNAFSGKPLKNRRATSSVPRPAALRPRTLKQNLLILVGSILCLKLLVFLTAAWTASHTPPDRTAYTASYHHLREDPRFTENGGSRFWELFSAADAQWYATIAEGGYPARSQFTLEGCRDELRLTTRCQNNLTWAFFPGWPALMRAVMPLAGDPFTAGFIAANLLSLAAAVILFLYMRSSHDETISLAAVLFLCASPFSLFFHAPFTESLFLFLAACLFLATGKRAWVAVGFCIALLSVIRPNGIFLAVVPVVFYINDMIRRRSFSWRKASRILWLGLALLPYFGWFWYNYAKTGDPFFFYTMQQRWFAGESMAGNLFHNLGALFRFSELQWHSFHSSRIDALVMAVSIVILAAGARRLKGMETAYAAAILVIPLISKDLMSYSRYAVAAWPLFLIIATWSVNRKWPAATILILSVIGQLLLTVRLVNWEWVG